MDAGGERELVRRAQSGDPEALHGLLAAHQPLTLRTVRPFVGCGVPLEDLMAEASIGLIEALARFEPERGLRFMTYATWWIRHSVVRALVAQGRNVRVPRRLLRGRDAQPIPVEVPLTGGGAGASELRAALAVAGDGVDVVFEGAEREEALRDALGRLTARQRLVLERRFGLAGHDDCTLQELATDLGLSKERVRQLEKQAMERVRVLLAGVPERED